MIDNLSYKQKTRLLLIAAVVALIVCYQLAISKTVNQYRTYKQNKLTVQSGGSGAEIHGLKQKIELLDSLFHRYRFDSTDHQRNALSISANWFIKHDMQLQEYSSPLYSTIDSFPIVSRQLSFNGNFIDCLEFVYALETKYRPGRISTATFKTMRDALTKKEDLNCTLSIQNIIIDDTTK